MAAKPNNPQALAELAHKYRNLGRWASNVQTPLAMRVQTMQTGRETHDDVEFNPEQTNSRLSQGMDLETTDAVVYRMDRLVQDLLASRKDLENEKRKTTDKDVEIAQLKQEVAHLLDRAHEEGQKREAAEAEMRELGRMSVVSSVNCEEVDELRRLLVFHKTNGEQLSRKLRDLQATYKDLEAQLQVTEMALQEQMSLVSGLGICTHGDNSSDS